MPTAATVINDYNILPQVEKTIVKTYINQTVISGTLHSFVADRRFAGGLSCSYCGSAHIVRNGKRKDGVQRYICRDCRKSSTATSNSIVANTRKDITVWQKFINCIVDNFSLRKAANECGISKNTAFAWRHKILDTLVAMEETITLDGIVEADETFFTVSYKGNHSSSKTFVMPRDAHHRGGETKKRGLSDEQVCCPCAVNRNGMSIAKAANRAKVKITGLDTAFGTQICSGSTMVTDKASAYQQFAKKNSIGLIQLKSGVDSRKGIYNLQHINNYHSKLKDFIYPHHGVSTKYLNNYLAWNNFVNYAKGDDNEKRSKLMSYAFTVYSDAKSKDVHCRPALPFAA